VREDVPADRSWYVSALRQELIARNSSYAALNFLPHVTSYGELPAVVYQRSECGRDHGNFISASYRAILKRPQWQRRLQKVHCHCRRSLPAIDEVARARFFIEFRRAADEHFLLPRVTGEWRFAESSVWNSGPPPEFGFMPRVPLLSEITERTEVDMKLRTMLFEAKLTEGDFRFSAPNSSSDTEILTTRSSVANFPGWFTCLIHG
jgi:hypothetical protein